MKDTHLIPIPELCTHYHLELSFFDELKNYGLIEITTVEQVYCIHKDRMPELEKMIRLHRELNLNFEGIDTVFNMLEKMERLQVELTTVKNRLRLYE
ncbi:MerR family transcriptional regulator [Subsaximicrobium wynnwilliamsii]|uniref:MerR family transcriptional regulator n=1 Tax=Subsaximicrobium wynnwilliamsii TaxID=291179 RepID=A0A5C6ZG14_9FLAO|nr:chaperone modulator CbpM [Subsaximicrobium wynnwilliamsii]TXD82846.1 MerR family transcriptional regulator [Subsaximicrobium wynnwilliamsii]TXD88568.1 MerR family transcriptional regulator [Subsaximicrobium wynnwilliamsii]TXE02435.1 MerR family transcriptional regulator [Subsaximicrobium wynnwilliamsii]